MDITPFLNSKTLYAKTLISMEAWDNLFWSYLWVFVKSIIETQGDKTGDTHSKIQSFQTV